LSNFDFSFKDISIFDVQSADFEDYIGKLQSDNKEHNLRFVRDIQEKTHSEYDKKYAIVKNNPKENYRYQDLLNVWKLLLIIFPSDLIIEYIIYYDEADNGFISSSTMSVWPKRITGEYPGELLLTTEEDVPEINEFAKLYFERLNLENYIGISIENYITSFSASHLHYQYLELCIALECIINGNQELTYRLRRTVAILCGKDDGNCRIIYDNLNKLYALRSKIIHGEEYSISKVQEYLQPLQAIVSRTIIELIIHNTPNIKELNESITGIGFGDRIKISEDWNSYKLNITTLVESNLKRLR